VQYSAGDLDRAVCELLDQHETWRGLLGETATREQARAALTSWQILPWAEQKDFMRQCILFIDIKDDNATMTVTFSPEVRGMQSGQSSVQRGCEPQRARFLTNPWEIPTNSRQTEPGLGMLTV